MRTVTATEASRSFAALLDEVEGGETIVVTRGGRRIASVSPASAGNGAEVLALLASGLPDEELADDVRAARTAVATRRTVLTTDRGARFGELPGVDCLAVP